MAGFFARHLSLRYPEQMSVDKRDQLFERIIVSGAPLA
jgi:hypothetical protein